MKHIQIFNEGWKDTLKSVVDYPSKKYKEGREKYLSQFKKPYEERSHAEKIICQALYFIEYQNIESNVLRYLGAIEAVLVMEKFLDPADKFNYEEKEKSFLFIKYKEKESYKSVIIRKAKDYLKQHNVL